MKKVYNTMFDKLIPQKSDNELLQEVLSTKTDITGVESNASVNSLIGTEGISMTKRKNKFKPLLIAAVIIITSVVSLLTVNAAIKGEKVKFAMGGEEIEGEFYDYVDGDGYRHISFNAVMPIYEENYAIIYDVDAPSEEAVRVITDETDPEFMGKIRELRNAQDQFFEELKIWYAEHNITQEEVRDPNSEFRKNFDSASALGRPYPQPEDFGLVFKDSELCTYHLGFVTKDEGFHLSDGTLGGEFMFIGAAEKHPSGDEEPNNCYYDWESETKTYRSSFFYYVGKE